MYKSWMAGLLLALLAAGAQAAEKHGAMQALQCKQQAQCAYFTDVYTADRGFRSAVQSAFRGSGGKAPAWVSNGVSTPLIPLKAGREDYLRGWVCEPHNCPHQLLVLYAPKRQQLVARYMRPDGKLVWLGRPNPRQKALLQDETDAASPLNGKLGDSTPLPLVLP
ncbi:Ivy family c-type lysozyme inhibitor [Vogesella sp. LIG4]|uniref:Ivy family c-type lysozyme inhibitor n=1 Tax=Vogesella sp. LIG4 TaxID=1192162 RepID=UPI00081F92D8|nr:Ivy family c-type lysozyme inhibitor [Vogesella sp. LIG4]SCK10719.1 Inhibitor of vertebrate lysozyme (Ivy) [Vogesella sp. LIG4]